MHIFMFMQDGIEIESSPSVRRRNGFKKTKASSATIRNISYMRGQLNPMIDDASYVSFFRICVVVCIVFYK